MVNLDRIFDNAKNLGRRIPVFGGLADCSWGDHRNACGQFFADGVFATLPLWLGTIILVITDQTKSIGYLSAFLSTFNSGELFLFCTATLGPIVFLVNKERAGERVFPGRLSHMIFVMAICLLCAVMFSLQRARVWLNPELLLRWSVGLYVFTLVLYYLTIVYDLMRLPSAPAIFKEQEESFTNELKDHRNS